MRTEANDKKRQSKIASCRVDLEKCTVDSPSGNTYHITESVEVDKMGSFYYRLTCDCPAYRECVHLVAYQAAAMNALYEESPDDGHMGGFEDMGNAVLG